MAQDSTAHKYAILSDCDPKRHIAFELSIYTEGLLSTQVGAYIREYYHPLVSWVRARRSQTIKGVREA